MPKNILIFAFLISLGIMPSALIAGSRQKPYSELHELVENKDFLELCSDKNGGMQKLLNDIYQVITSAEECNLKINGPDSTKINGSDLTIDKKIRGWHS